LLLWVEEAIANFPIDSLPDEQVLQLCDLQLDSQQQDTLSQLLQKNQEGELTPTETQQLDELMQFYRQGMVNKAKALNIAVKRGLRPELDK
ncbi:MAG: hypothetical protein F6K03_17800, partial [Kamptonema sp. SIO4C4]|nr:hypothetical protein [Kamptonema sp. SIO4C4]